MPRGGANNKKPPCGKGMFAMIGIIGAMDIEIEAVAAAIEDPVFEEIAGCTFACGHIDSVMTVVARCNPGKVNAAICAQIMVDRFGADRLINIGVGCSLAAQVQIKNIVIASDVCQYDIDMTAIGDPLGYINGLNVIKIKTDDDISEKLARIAINSGEKIHRGTIASGDKFIASKQLKDDIAANFGAICGEMEGGAVAQVAAANGVPFGVLRSVSDGGDDGAAMDYPTFKKAAAAKSAAIILKYIKGEKTQLELE